MVLNLNQLHAGARLTPSRNAPASEYADLSK